MAPPIRLTSLAALVEHVEIVGKGERYRSMLRTLGIEPELWPPLAMHPCPVLFEQAGCWFGVEDLARAELVKHLHSHVAVHERSGLWTLGCDAFTTAGLKGTATRFCLHPGFGIASWIGARAGRRARHRTLDAVGIEPRRVAALLELAVGFLEGAERGRLRAAAAELARQRLPAGVRRALPRATSRRELDALQQRLEQVDLAAARQRLITMAGQLQGAGTWLEFWTAVNESWLRAPLWRADALVQRALLAVREPEQAVRTLARLAGVRLEEQPLAAIVTPEGKYRMVYFDPERRCFVYRPRGTEWCRISWQEVRALARAGRSGGPAAVLEYLLMAAAGIYLVSACYDGRCRYERTAYRAHRELTGFSFPVITLPDEDLYSGYFLHLYSRRWRSRREAATRKFLAGPHGEAAARERAGITAPQLATRRGSPR